MYKVYYKDNVIDEDIVENIDSLVIDVKDINNMKYVDIIYNGDINLLILYVKCLKYYHSKLRITDKFIINNNFKENENIIRSVLNCNWLINEDDVINNLDKLEEIKKEFQEEISLLSNSKTLKAMHKIYLMQYFINTLKHAKIRAGIIDVDDKKMIKK